MRTNKWEPVIKYIFWGLLLAFVLPTCANFVLQRYEDHSEFNKLILTQGIQPYRTKQIECNYQSIALVNATANRLEDWKLVQTILQQNTSVNQNSFFVPKDQQEQISMYVKNAFEIEPQINAKLTQLNYCHDETVTDAENIAMLLNILPEYQTLYRNFQNILQGIAKKQQATGKAALAMLDLPDLSKISDLDQFNRLLINPTSKFQNLDNDALVKKVNSMLDLNINLREKQLSFALEYHNAWTQFYLQTNRMFLQAFQKRLS